MGYYYLLSTYLLCDTYVPTYLRDLGSTYLSNYLLHIVLLSTHLLLDTYLLIGTYLLTTTSRYYLSITYQARYLLGY
jgi:hypothetical protein